ncbi:MAG TPA: M23 family metallopeptidase [Xanthomonadaceae bacterium]|nr:M23 family metallopeptidase [Xanthomonadaceae bacterium]
MTLQKATLQSLLHDTRGGLVRVARQLRAAARRQPALATVLLLAAGVAFGAGARAGAGSIELTHLRAQAAQQQAALDNTRAQAQREVNALAARLAELQAQANRLNALGERLTRVAKLNDGEFDFDKPVGIGGVGAVHDMHPGELRTGLGQLGSQFDTAGGQLSVLESLLFNRKLDQRATPSRMPIADSYITSGFGGRADPFGGGAAFHKGIDFHASIGDPVLAVADGVVSYAGQRSGYGNVVEIDHGNGYVTRYAHNSRLLVRVGELVHQGQQVARAGSTGRSTGAHVHFEVWVAGRVVNPSRFLGQRPVTRG